MPDFDRGFIKWQPFNSVISSKEILDNLNNKEAVIKPTLFQEKQDDLNKLILEAYYSKNKINISFYEQNKIKNLYTSVTKIYPNTNTLVLDNHKIISFNQIININ